MVGERYTQTKGSKKKIQEGHKPGNTRATNGR